ncbi:hypothetical protein Tco_0542188 [Tanacetum coccineum]
MEVLARLLGDVMGASFTQGTVSSIPIVGSISPEGFLPPILLLVVIIVTVVIVAVILVVFVVAIVGVVIVVAIIGGIQGQYLFVKSLLNSVQLILFARSIPIGWAYAFHLDKASSVRVPVGNVTMFYLFPIFVTEVLVGPVFLLGLLVPAIVAACASKAAETLSTTSFLMAALESMAVLLMLTSL